MSVGLRRFTLSGEVLAGGPVTLRTPVGDPDASSPT